MPSNSSIRMRCLKTMQKTGADTVEMDPVRCSTSNAAIPKRLLGTAWSGGKDCSNGYVETHGYDSANGSGLAAPVPGLRTEVIAPPHGVAEAVKAVLLRVCLRTAFRTLIGPPFSPRLQRLAMAAMSPLMPGVSGVLRYRQIAGGVPVEVVAPPHGEHHGAILFLHGGAFCVGNPGTHRSITTRLAQESGLPVWVPDYRLAPENPYPAGLEDALAVYQALRQQGIHASRIVIAGDSAGGALALALALTLKDQGEPAAAGLLLLSPVTDPSLQGDSMQGRAKADPMIRRGWLKQALHWYRPDPAARRNTPLQAALRGLPSMFIQVGEDEVLLSDATRLAESASQQGVPCRLEVHAGRWHVFQLQSFYLASARAAVGRLAAFALECVQASDVPMRDGRL